MKRKPRLRADFLTTTCKTTNRGRRSVSGTERSKLEEIVFPLHSLKPHAFRPVCGGTRPKFGNGFDSHVGATTFQLNNISSLKLVVHLAAPCARDKKW